MPVVRIRRARPREPDVKLGETEAPRGKSVFFIDPVRMQSRWLEGLTHATDRYLRSRWFSGGMLLGFAVLRGAHSLHTTAAQLLGRGNALDEHPQGSGAARRT